VACTAEARSVRFNNLSLVYDPVYFLPACVAMRSDRFDVVPVMFCKEKVSLFGPQFVFSELLPQKTRSSTASTPL
jgi:hypothetical protein